MKQNLCWQRSQRPQRPQRPQRFAGEPHEHAGDEPEDIRALARVHAREAIAALAEIVADRSARASNRVAAANAILDRAYGKPAQALTGADGGPIALADPPALSEPERLHRIAALLEGVKAHGRA